MSREAQEGSIPTSLTPTSFPKRLSATPPLSANSPTPTHWRVLPSAWRDERKVIRIDRKCSGARELGRGIKLIAGAVPISYLNIAARECRGLNRLGIE